MATYRCPTDTRHEADLVGCGETFDAEPDNEGYVDCPKCGLWFSVADNVVRQVAARIVYDD